MTTTIGFVGLGDMGGALVHALTAAGLAPVVYDLDTSRVEQAVAEGAVAAGSLAEVGEAAGIVGICVATDDQVRSVIDGGLLESLEFGAVVTLHSTLLPETVHWVVERAAARGVGVVEAPVTGGATAAAEGRVTFILAGDPGHLATVEPLLDACAGVRIDAGAIGRANLLKLCINLQTYATHMAVHEAASFATALGLSLDGLKAAMEANGQLGEGIRSYLILHDLTDEQLDDPALVAMRAPNVAIIGKDIGLMEQVAADIDFELPVAHLTGERVVETYRMPGRAK